MIVKRIAEAIHREVTEENLEIFRRRYLETNYEAVTNHEFRRAMELAQRLSAEDRSTFLTILRQVSVDTASTVLGVFEGVVALEDVEGQFSLKYDGEEISEEIQSYFLIAEEEIQEAT